MERVAGSKNKGKSRRTLSGDVHDLVQTNIKAARRRRNVSLIFGSEEYLKLASKAQTNSEAIAQQIQDSLSVRMFFNSPIPDFSKPAVAPICEGVENQP